MNDDNIIDSLELDFSKVYFRYKFLENYMAVSNFRSQYVKINGYKSNPGNLCYGVLQGSILGPLLFILYTNDLSLYIKLSRMHSYADDSNISASSKCLKNLIFNQQNDLNSIIIWFNVNKMVLNAKKSFC